jgi:hypothetical protein
MALRVVMPNEDLGMSPAKALRRKGLKKTPFPKLAPLRPFDFTQDMLREKYPEIWSGA